eukprot:Gregarina_sp_Poly_1__1928@NODE_1504_length_3979_cov_42_233129_g996_i0_p2_GENE_NODE_1504_length_3979_cov_42_233129_g996_i0NODE_1504_length_3979_cov_42_233129_g996_i0_p2_ORF_typecomplete_len148_score25_14Trm112p/PF03966_16/0_0035Ntox1/PF15500_6/0_17_NODE_1504_length_3979_cov_42_233129_g996_i0324767
MRLLTHNLLMCNKADCSGGFPLRIELASEEELEKRRVHIQEYENAAPKSAADLDSSVSKVAELKNHEILPAEMNPVFVRNMLGKIEWPILAEAANQVVKLSALQSAPNLSSSIWSFLIAIKRVIWKTSNFCNQYTEPLTNSTSLKGF